MYLMFVSTALGTLMGLKRVCPKCGQSQVVSAEMRNRAVPCKSCGVSIPPKKSIRHKP